MKSRKPAKSNGKTDTPKVKEVYGARIEKQNGSISAASLRAKNLKDRHKNEQPKPPRNYDHGNTVYVHVKGIPFTNGLVVGHEWGGDYRPLGNPNEWVYWIRDVSKPRGSEMFAVKESQISDRISL